MVGLKHAMSVEVQFTLNEDAPPEDSAHVRPPEEHQIRQDEHGRREGAEEGGAAPSHCQGEILLLGNQ